MIVIEQIVKMIVEEIIFGIIIGGVARINNAILKLRGIETKSPSEIKLEKFRKRYEYKKVKLLKAHEEIEKGSIGVVLELMDSKKASVELNENQEIIEMNLKNLLLIRKDKTK